MRLNPILFLASNRSRCYFKSIHMITFSRLFLRLAVSLSLLAVTPLQADDGIDPTFKPLFNGKDLNGWEGNTNFWSFKDGIVEGRTTAEIPTKGNTFLIWRQGNVDDFELRMSYRIVGGNSGVQYRSKDHGNFVVGGYQADFEAGDTYSGILYEERGPRGIMAERGQKVEWDKEGKKQVLGAVDDAKAIQAGIRKEEWNDYTIIVQGNRLIHKINSMTTVDVTDNDPKNQVFAGVLALQLHAGPPMVVQFKNVRMKRLKLSDDRKKIVLVAGKQSHSKGEHEFSAGVQLLNKCLTGLPGVFSTFYLNGWPADITAFDNADSILFYADGGGGHPVIQPERLAILEALAMKGVGLSFGHYGVEIPKDRGGKQFLKWIGGYFEEHWSVNPTWEAAVTFPTHEVTQGVTQGDVAVMIKDEWYYNMRFRTRMKGVEAVAIATPPDSTREGADSPHGGNPFVRAQIGKEQRETLAWVSHGANRGFGFTGGHFHKNWGNEQFRKLVLNGLLWTAHVEVPENGVESVVTPEDLLKNLDPKK